MFAFTASLDGGDVRQSLATLIKPQLVPDIFKGRIQRLERLYSAYLHSAPPPWSAPGLCITPEIQYQSNQWLPLDELRPHFYYVYRQTLNYSPIFSSTPFASATSWADITDVFPHFMGYSANPARIIERLLTDHGLRTKFLFWSFMPRRFYGGGSDRYPLQTAILTDWLRKRQGCGESLRCLDAASGDGVAAYGLARLLLESGWHPDCFRVEGWTLDPLEACAAAHAVFPHDPQHEMVLRDWTRPVFERSAHSSVLFRVSDLSEATEAPSGQNFELIICNGLLGGPIINRPEDMRRMVSNLAGMLAPGGLLVAADHFHGGWKQQCPQQELQALLTMNGLTVVAVQEGVAGLRART